MIEDFHKLRNEDTISDDKCDMNFNRVDTFVNNGLLFRHYDIIQNDIYFKSPVHYLLHLDKEIDKLLELIFKNHAEGNKLP